MSLQVHNTRFIGQKFIKLNEIDSTNQYAKQLLANNEPLHGTVIMADYQTSGRGQSNNQWNSAAGKNLLLSILIQLKEIDVRHQFYFNMVVAISIAKTLERFVEEKVEIKWPNDILISEQKVSGILIENFLTKSFISTFIIGIGLNVNQTHFPTNLKNVTSLMLATGVECSREKVLETLCTTLEDYIELFTAQKFGEIKRLYFSKLFRYQEIHQFSVNGKIITGEIIGVSDTGLLQVSVNNKLTSFANKEIEFVF